VRIAHDVERAIWMAEDDPPEYALVDLKMPNASGLTLVQRLKQIDSGTCVVVLTGYASIATAIEAIKLGATHYLAKPARTEEILAAFQTHRAYALDVPIQGEIRCACAKLEWEHIQKVLVEKSRAISAPRRRRQLGAASAHAVQRKLSKPAKILSNTSLTPIAGSDLDRAHRPNPSRG
jgi:two-component system response regulator RegA